MTNLVIESPEETTLSPQDTKLATVRTQYPGAKITAIGHDRYRINYFEPWTPVIRLLEAIVVW